MSFLFFSSIVFIAVTLLLFVVLHLKNKDYSMTANAVSDYAIGSTSVLFIVYVTTGIISHLCLLLGILTSQNSILGLQIACYLAGIIICRTGLMFFKTDIEGKRLTLPGLIHYVFAIGSFTLMYLFVDSSVTSFRNFNGLENLNGFFSIYRTGFAVSLALVCITMIPKLRKIFGLFERIFLLSGNLWVGICSFILIKNI